MMTNNHYWDGSIVIFYIKWNALLLSAFAILFIDNVLSNLFLIYNIFAQNVSYLFSQSQALMPHLIKTLIITAFTKKRKHNVGALYCCHLSRLIWVRIQMVHYAFVRCQTANAKGYYGVKMKNIFKPAVCIMNNYCQKD